MPVKAQRKPLANGDQWFVNHIRVLLVTPGGPGVPRLVHYTDGRIVPLQPTDLVTCTPAPKPKPGEVSPLPLFDVNSGRPLAAATPPLGVGYLESLKDARADRRASLPGNTGGFVRASGVQAGTSGTVRKQLRFYTPAPRATSRSKSGAVVLAGTMAEPVDPVAGRFALISDEEAAAVDRSTLELIDDVPLELPATDAILMLLEKSVDGLAKEDIALLLRHAADYQPSEADQEPFKMWWSQQAFRQLGDPTKLSKRHFGYYMDSLGIVNANTAPFDEEADGDGGDEEAHGYEECAPQGEPAVAPEGAATGTDAAMEVDELYADLPPTPTERGRTVTRSLSAFGAAVYPDCFVHYMPDNGAD